MTVLSEAKTQLERQEDKGIKKYGGVLEDTNPTAEALIEHAIEEAADQLMYLVALRRRISLTGR